MNTDTKETALSKWEALKSPKGIAAAVVAVLSTLVGGAYLGEGFTIEFSTCEAPEVAKEAPDPKGADSDDQ